MSSTRLSRRMPKFTSRRWNGKESRTETCAGRNHEEKQDGQLIAPPRPAWSFDQCKLTGVCNRWMSRGVCLIPDCRYKHHIPEDLKKPVPAQAHMFHNGFDTTFGRGDSQVNLGLLRKRSALINEFNTNKELESHVAPIIMYFL